jgi:hypothetical protein
MCEGAEMIKRVGIQMKSGNKFLVDVEEEKLPELLAKISPYNTEFTDLLKFLPKGAKTPFDNMFIIPAEADSIVIGPMSAFGQGQSQIKIPQIRV